MTKPDLGPCPVCGAAHCACGAAAPEDRWDVQVEIPQCPERDALALKQITTEPPAEFVLPEVSEEVSTADYSRAKHGIKRPR